MLCSRPGLVSRPLPVLVALMVATRLWAGVAEGLVAYWTFDEVAGTTLSDATTNAVDGVLRNFPAEPSWPTGRVGQSLFFGGPAAESFVWVERYPVLIRVTVSAWVLAESRPTWSSIIKNWGSSQTGQFHFGLNSSDGGLSCYLTLEGGSQAVVREGTPFPLQDWQHVAFTHDGATLRLFRNGTEVASASAVGALMPPVSQALGIGVKLSNSGTEPDTGAPGYWHGRLDELAVWSRALAGREITAIYQAGLLGRGLLQAEAGPVVTGSGIRLSEYMASNSRTLEDDFGEDSDWIEIHNDTTNAVDLAGWSLTDSPGQSAKWIFPSTNVLPGQFLVVYASGRDQRLPGRALHANFKLSAEGEFLALMRPDGMTADAFRSPPPQYTDISFGHPSTYEQEPGFFLQPTPGAPNLDGAMLAGPLLTGAAFEPPAPQTNDTLRITCRVDPFRSAPTNVTIHFRVMFQPEISFPMVDDGQHGDGLPGDGIFGALIRPRDVSSLVQPGTMVRWRFTAEDQVGNAARLPLFAQSRAAQYFGTVVQPEAFTTGAVPVLHFYAENPAAADTDAGTTCSLFYQGQFRDRCDVRIRGGSARLWPRKSYKFDLNPGEKLVVRAGAPRVGEFNLNSPYTDKSYVRAVLASEFLLLAGLPAPEEFHLRVFRNGAFHSLGIYVEQMNDEFLARHGLDPDGAYYKAQGDPLGTYEKKSRIAENDSDLKQLLAGLASVGPDLQVFVFDHLNVANVINYMASVAILQDIDASDKNHYLHRDSRGSGEWRILPWDLDLTFGPDYLNTDTIVYHLCDVAGVHCPSHPFIGARPYLLHPGKYHPLLEAIVKIPRAREMLLRRIRTLRDQFLAAGYFEDRIEAFFAHLSPDVQADRQAWKANAHFSGKTYTFRQALDRIKHEYLAPRSGFLTSTSIPGIGAAMPAAQDSAVTLLFGGAESGLHLGDLEQQYIELVNTNTVSVDVSGWRLGGSLAHRFEAGTVLPAGGKLLVVANAAAFRSRTVAPSGGMGLFVQGNYDGRLSRQGGRLQLIDAADRVVASSTFPSVTPAFTALEAVAGGIRVTARGQPAIQYELEHTRSLAVPAWTRLGSAAANPFGLIEFVDEASPGATGFYRLRATIVAAEATKR